MTILAMHIFSLQKSHGNMVCEHASSGFVGFMFVVRIANEDHVYHVIMVGHTLGAS